MKPDASAGKARREKNRLAGMRSGQQRRSKNDPLRIAVSALLEKTPGITNSKLASLLFSKYGRPRGDRVKDLRALAKRIGRIAEK